MSPSRLRRYGRHFCSAIREESAAGWPFSQLAVRARHHEPAARAPRSGVEMAVSDPGRGAADDAGRRRAIAGLLAVYRDADVAWGWFALAAAGIVLAHMANNLMNDLFDLEVGTDREDYPRNLYSPHPVLSGVITRKGLARVRARGQRDLPRDHDRAHGRAGLADRRRSRSAASCSRPRTPRRRCG